VTGLIVGKFCPPHRGHQHLIDTARTQVDRLVVMVCATENQSISGEKRRDWLQEIHPDCEIILVEETLAEDPAP